MSFSIFEQELGYYSKSIFETLLKFKDIFKNKIVTVSTKN